MNIVVVTDFGFVDGGASKIALGSALALSERGHQVTVFCAVGPVAPELAASPALSVMCLHQFEIVQDPQRLRAVVNGIWNATAAEKFDRLLSSLSPSETILHVHTWTKALSASVLRKAMDRGFSLVLTLHDYFTACPTGSFFLYPQQTPCTLRPLSAACISTQCDSRNYGHKLWRVARQWVANHKAELPANISAFISISSLSEEILRPYLPVQAPIFRVPNFISVQQQAPSDVAANDRVCYVGRLSPEKGPMLAALCATRLGVDITFVGSGPQQADIARAAPGATFTGWLPHSGVTAAIAGSRCLVFPSLWYETQGLVVAEAAALGVPSVVAAGSAAREWVEDGVTGLLFRSGDAADLAEKMARLYREPALAASLGQAAYARFWKAPASLNAHCERLEWVYTSVMMQRK